ncbi:helix-turn-helix domain-containing protein [Fusibacter sp. 3D3]|uniref:helix-turn-helix domain-containing protein n=1 Tax=Fusibacter sp. 3D3 TaxID=1048380 RepID=UPI000853BC84|nr:helix-turn-helix domain-containing protein [Fusibacter sp. 3D3]GAU78185.1 ammonium transporter [Fusibacter sp. 3D3]
MSVLKKNTIPTESLEAYKESVEAEVLKGALEAWGGNITKAAEKLGISRWSLHRIPLIAIGTAILWFGWYGFNAGSELRVDSITALAFLNTDISASFAAIVWLDSWRG